MDSSTENALVRGGYHVTNDWSQVPVDALAKITEVKAAFMLWKSASV